VTVRKDRNLKIKLNRETLLKLEQSTLSGVYGGTGDAGVKEDFALLTSNNTRREPCCGCA
jgi:hypothetical protein